MINGQLVKIDCTVLTYIISMCLVIFKLPKFVVHSKTKQFGSVAHETLFHFVVEISQVLPDYKISLLLS